MMRASRNKPVIEGSQASQILEQAFDGGFDASGSHSSNLHDHNRRTDTERDLSSDATSPQASRYQYFGLDATQTDTQLLDEDEVDEGLLRGNKRSFPVKAMKGVQEPTNAGPRSTRFQQVKEATPSKPPISKARSSPLPRDTTLVKETNTKIPPHRNSPQTRRSTYPALDTDSQDSFIGAFEESIDPAARYIAGAEQLNVPLSQLGRIAEEREAMLKMGRGVLLRRVHTPSPPPASPPQGRVLVDSTPSISGSQEEAMNQNRVDDYDYGQAQEPDMDVDLERQEPSQLSSEVSAPSSSLYEYINALDAGIEPNDSPDEPLVATQPMDFSDTTHFTETTQTFSDRTPIVSQVERLPEGALALRITKYLAQLSPGEEISKSAHRLLTYVDWAKLWRYDYDVRPVFELAQSLGLYQTALDVATKMLKEDDEAAEAKRLAPPRQPAYQETQPSTEDEGPSAAQAETQPSTVEETLPRRRGFPSRPKAFQRIPPTDSTTDNTVPDSEPLRQDTQPSAPAPSAVTKSPAIEKRRVIRPSSPDFHPNSDEIVPDSVEMDNPMDIDATVEHPEDDEDDEDDMPLAKLTSNKGKGVQRNKKEVNMPPPAVPKKPTSKAKGKQRAVSPVEVRQTRRTNPTPGYLLGSWENGIVPSSLPEQDGVAKKDVPAQTKAPTKAKVTRPTTKATGSKVASSSKTTQGAVREELSPLSDLTEDHIPKADHGDDASTEPAYDGDEYEEPVDEEKPNKKRKRRDSGSTAKSGTKAAPKRAKRAKKPETPAAVRPKSLRSSAPASSSRIGGKPTRVYALWKTEAHYFLGTVHSMKPHGKYLVKFDDGTEADVTLDQMRLAQLNVGDEVAPIGLKKKTCKVVNVDDQHNTETVTIKLDGEEEEMKRADITIHMKTINYAWKDRKLTSDTVVTKLKHPQPSPSRLSISSTAGPRPTSSVLSEYGIVITLSPDSTLTKEKIANVVRGGGGAVIDDWTSVLSLDGKYDRDGRRWVITQGEIAWIGNIDQTRKVFLVSDECNEKPRYLVAVALGVPCLSFKWVEACIKEDTEIEWVPHLLAQGFVEPLEANVSQYVDTLWCSTSEHLRHIMDNKVPHKILKNKTALCVGRELIPIQGKKTDVPGSHFIGQILVCMGAKRVETVADLNDASKQATEYDLVVIKESTNYRDDLDGATVVDTQWVKYSLLAGRMLPLPEWSRP
ncbi:BRCT domain-containing protein [Pleurotus pulmonarius]